MPLSTIFGPNRLQTATRAAGALLVAVAGLGCGGGAPPGPEPPATPQVEPLGEPLLEEVSDDAPVPQAEDASIADATPTQGPESEAEPGPLVTCHCLTYPNLTGGVLVTVKDCYGTARGCTDARAERLRGRGRDEPPVPQCETESRPACGQAVFEE